MLLNFSSQLLQALHWCEILILVVVFLHQHSFGVNNLFNKKKKHIPARISLFIFVWFVPVTKWL